ncbi:Fic family protein [Massilia sp. CCM 8733]|uniref:Fic family protein n=1 Tax=Massilia mucilaginosa TaxID=2609282 RepID=A0ABX0P4F8_9BURK|nr:Fic family protein [Massilia mucilaginosa]NHZ93611.1 Fic family protein [Massilia mucilaginosa]
MTPYQVGFNLEGAVEYHYGKFPPVSLDYAKVVNPLVEATSALARYDQMLKAMHNSEILLAPMRSQEAVISSRMEGTVSTLDEILQYEADHAEGQEDLSRARSEVIETWLYQRALTTAQEQMEHGQPLSPYLIRAAHEKLLSVGRGAKKDPGRFKTEQNYLADRYKKILFVPIRPEQLHDGMDALFKYLNESSDTPLIKAALSHVEFEALHPFKDGNGRIGRMLITLLLWSSATISQPHFYISGYFEEHKDEYIDTMRHVSETDDWTSWCVFFLHAVKAQAIRNLEVAENIRTLYEDMKIRFIEILGSRWSVSALDFIFTNPIFKSNKFTTQSGIPASTALRFLRTLSDKQLLTTVSEASGRRPAMYSFEPLLVLVRV